LQHRKPILQARKAVKTEGIFARISQSAPNRLTQTLSQFALLLNLIETDFYLPDSAPSKANGNG
jgi:hypothetical protein